MGTSDDIEALVGWTGDAGVLTRALADAGAPEGYGFLEPVAESQQREQAYRVHDLWHHAPDYVAKRRRRELDRQLKLDPGGVSRTAPNGAEQTGMSDWHNGEPPPPSPSHSPSHSPSQKNGAEPDASSPVLTFSTIGTGPKVWVLTSARVAEWSEAFPGLDILAEARKALAWVNANAGRKKTARGMPSFLVGWLGRATNRGGSVQASTPARAQIGGSSCQHVPRCERFSDCTKRTIDEGRRLRGAAS